RAKSLFPGKPQRSLARVFCFRNRVLAPDISSVPACTDRLKLPPFGRRNPKNAKSRLFAARNGFPSVFSPHENDPRYENPKRTGSSPPLPQFGRLDPGSGLTDRRKYRIWNG